MFLNNKFYIESIYFGQLTPFQMADVGSTAMQAGWPQSAWQTIIGTSIYFYTSSWKAALKVVSPEYTHNAHGLDNSKHKDDDNKRIWEIPTSPRLLVGHYSWVYGEMSLCPFACHCQSSPQRHPAWASDADIYKPWMMWSGEVWYISANEQQCFKFCSLGPRSDCCKKGLPWQS